MSAVTQMLLASYGGVVPITVTLEDTPAVQTADATTWTFTAAAVGTAASDRDIVVVITYGFDPASARSISSVTVAGNAATADYSNNSTTGRSGSGIYRYRLTSGTTADIVVTLSGNTTNCAIAVYSMRGASTTVYNVASPIAIAAGDSSQTCTVDWINGGATFGLVCNTAGSSHSFSSGVTTSINRVVEGTQRQAIGYRVQTSTASAQNVTATFTAGGVGRIGAVSYAPA